MSREEAEAIKQHSLFVSELIIVAIRAEKPNADSEMLYYNHFVNSPYGVCPLR